MLVTRPANWSAAVPTGAEGMYQPGVPGRAFSDGTGPESARPTAGDIRASVAASAANATTRANHGPSLMRPSMSQPPAVSVAGSGRPRQSYEDAIHGTTPGVAGHRPS